MQPIDFPVYVRRALQISALHIQYQHHYQDDPSIWCLSVRPEPWRIEFEEPIKCDWHDKRWTIACVHLFYDRGYKITLYLKQGSDPNLIRDWKALRLTTIFQEDGAACRAEHEGNTLYQLLVEAYGMDIYDLEHRKLASTPVFMKKPGQQEVRYGFPDGSIWDVTLNYELIDGRIMRRIDPPAHMHSLMKPWYV